MFKYSLLLLLFFCLTTPLLATSPTPLTPLEPLPQHSISTRLITQFIDGEHYRQVELNDQQSKEILKKYLTTLDPNRSFFTQQDIASFERYQLTLDDALKSGDMSPAFTIFQRYNQRRIERADYALARLPQVFDFTVDEVLELDRSESAWANNRAALDEI